MPDGAELHSPSSWFDEPDHGKECADRGGPGHGAGVIGFTDRRSSDIKRQLDAVPAIGSQVSKVVSCSADPELVILLVDDIGRRRAVRCILPHIRLGE